MNGITKRKDVYHGLINEHHLIDALFKDLGFHVSSMPDDYPAELIFTNEIEIFDPEKVNEEKDLPDYWKRVYQMHNKPNMKDCVDLRYRYIHVPFKIMCQYPSIPCSGIFVIDRDIDLRKKINPSRLININNELED